MCASFCPLTNADDIKKKNVCSCQNLVSHKHKKRTCFLANRLVNHYRIRNKPWHIIMFIVISSYQHQCKAIRESARPPLSQPISTKYTPRLSHERLSISGTHALWLSRALLPSPAPATAHPLPASPQCLLVGRAAPLCAPASASA